MKHEEFLRENDEGDRGFTLNKSKMEGFIEIKIKFFIVLLFHLNFDQI